MSCTLLFCGVSPRASVNPPGTSSSGLQAVKICAVSRAEDAAMIARVCNERLPPGIASYLGMILWPHSKRSVHDRGLVREIANIARDGGMQPVGVFVDESMDQVVDFCDDCGLDMIQLHGSGVRQAWTDDVNWESTEHRLKWIDVMDVDDDYVTPLQSAGNAERRKPEWTIFDAKGGGTGNPFDWSRFSTPNFPWLLAGGLHPDNVEKAVQTLRPTGLDVASGVAGPDKIVKDEKRLIDFLEKAMNAYL